jgi:hypothetical protein
MAQTPTPVPGFQPQVIPNELTSLPKDKVVIQVNDTKITAGEMEQILMAYPENSRVYMRGPGRQQFIDNLVRTFALSDEGKRLKVDESPTFKAQARFSTAAILANQLGEELKRNIKVDDEALKKYYEDHKNEYLKVRARHILIRMTGAPVPVKPGQKDLSEADALAKANEVLAKIRGGADFAAVAKEESDDTGSGANGGELGMFGHGQMVPTFEEAAFKLKPGEISEPVKSQFGYHIIQTEERQEKSFDELKPELEAKIRPDLARKEIDELAKKAKVVLDPDLLGSSKIQK